MNVPILAEEYLSRLAELKKEILSKAAIYKKQKKDKNFKEYKGSSVDTTK